MTAAYEVTLDSKRRPTLPAALLEEAHLSASASLVARAEGEGRIVLETREAVKQRLWRRYAQGRAQAGRTRSAVESLLAERAADRSLE